MIPMPSVVQRPSPNYSPTTITPRLIVVHRTEGAYEGAVAFLCLPSTPASAHIVIKADGSEVSQLVPFIMKAWHACLFNSVALGFEVEGFTANGLAEDTAQVVARIVAWACRAYDIPPVWAERGEGRGICTHHDLGPAGGGHVDICPVGDPIWLHLVDLVKAAYDEFGGGALPEFGVHGLPNPGLAKLPPPSPPVASHGGADRRSSIDPTIHPTLTSAPLGSVADVQRRLRIAQANPTLVIDGVDGPGTHAALGVFQRATGLPVTNDLNPATWTKLLQLSGGA
jgi:hypothetical protein